ncbi:VWA domain-containing protein [Diaminobutyricimonas sp. LJ205]|uniref:vWA domain-containing protein n=1 Tax=Diaminobutyricimonas sp. LJ205 TaxID=2683590 RepID=UPI0012F4F4DA|nr:VWA domain-containing protein [Diaminobutyricimonas sp. LJ205]
MITATQDDRGLTATLLTLVSSLRDKGIPVGTGETLDAANAMVALGVSDRDTVREALKATLIRRGGDQTTFDALFDLWFGGPSDSDRYPADASVDDLNARLARALRTGDIRTVERLAVVAVEAHGRVAKSRGSLSAWSALQTLGAVGRDEVLTLARGLDDEVGGSIIAARSSRGWDVFSQRIQREVRLRTGAQKGAQRVADYGVLANINRRDFLNASADELEQIQRLVSPLARQIASAMSLKSHQSRRGHIDVRRTMRAALSTGGIPVKPVAKRRRPTRPRLVVLCDVSGSVAGFSGFTSMLLAGIAQSVRQVRLYPFVNRVAESTGLLRQTRSPDAFLTGLVDDPRIRSGHGNSDYGQVFEEFCEQHLAAVSPRTTVLILGDARSNGRPPCTGALREIAARARRLYWLNPERFALWGTGDSHASEYATAVAMHECRNVAQLEHFVRRTLTG